MRLTELTQQDLVLIAQLFKAFEIAKFPDLTGKDVTALNQVRQFVAQMAKDAGDEYKLRQAKPATPLVPKKTTSKLTTKSDKKTRSKK